VGRNYLPYVLTKALGGNVTPGFWHIWRLVWHGVIGWLLIFGTAGAIDAHCPEQQTLSPSLYYYRL
jgi:hypothetical protein